jgi:hypothetical protein
MSPRYGAWLASLALRDATLISLAVSGIALALAWCLLDLVPLPWSARLKRLYLIAGIPLYLATIAYGIFGGGA